MKKLLYKIDSSLESDLKKAIDEELNKPDMDCNKITELSSMLTELRSKNIDNDSSKEHLIEKITSNSTNEKPRRFKMPKWVAYAAMFAICFFGINIVSTSVFGANTISFVAEYVKGGVNIRFKDKQDDIIQLPVTEGDPYGIKAKCAEYGIYPETPEYIPEGFVLLRMYDVIEENSTTLVFNYRYKSKKISIFYHYYKDIREIENTSFGLSSDKHNIYEEEINGHKIILSWEDEQFQALYNYDNIVCKLWIEDLDYDTAHKILESFR